MIKGTHRVVVLDENDANPQILTAPMPLSTCMAIANLENTRLESGRAVVVTLTGFEVK